MTVAFALPSNKKPQHSVVLVIIFFFQLLTIFRLSISVLIVLESGIFVVKFFHYLARERI